MERIREIDTANSRSNKPLDYLIDGMSLVQKLKVDYLTFGEIAEKILSRVLREGGGSK